MKFDKQKLSEERKKKNLSADDLAFEIRKRKLNITGQTITRWEKGLSIPGAHYLAEICMVLNVSPIVFFTNKKGGVSEKNLK